ncbi:DUF6221 family protein [Streptomyces sp. NRRL S-241]|uniref:DUF6221 family protein n=1 Tax=Streptomyces sp. NRRL S-241 TaxID=1463896 RepID=UPI000B336DBA|nr:DUF6221 family protein [Streptomyces sp. NRRL S-241]
MDLFMQFLHSRLDEDEEAARRAAALCGCHPAAASWEFRDGDDEEGGRILVVGDPHPVLLGKRRRLARRWNRSYDGLFAAQHIVRHDPARVLAEVDAKRRMLEAHAIVHREIGWLADGEEAYDELPVCGACVLKHTHYPSRDNVPEGACLTARLLALPYASHPEYRDEWRPGT